MKINYCLVYIFSKSKIYKNSDQKNNPNLICSKYLNMANIRL